MATNQGLLQAQIKVKNTIDLNNAFSSPSVANPQLKSIEGELNLSNEYALQSFNSSNTNTQHIDTIRTNSSNTSLKEALNNLPTLKYVRLEGSYESKGNSFDNNTNLQKVDLSESLQVKPEDFKANNNLKELPKLNYSNPDLTDIITNDTNLKSTTFDISNEPNTNKLGIHGDSTHQLGNLESVKVNPEAPFDNQITPQIDVSYTSLDRNGLVNLFNTMPYNLGYTVVGSPTITDGIASGFSNSNYLVLSQNITIKPTDTAEVVFNFTSPATATTESGMIGGIRTTSGNGIGMYHYVSWGAYWVVQGIGDVYNAPGASENVFADWNTEYTIKAIYNSDGTGNAKVYNNNGTLIAEKIQNTPRTSDIIISVFGLPINGRVVQNIDLNHTYIKVNSIVSTGPVNYTTVGSPTIVDNVVSGFSADNYLSFSQYPNLSKDFEISICVSPTSLGAGTLIGTNNYYYQGIYFTNNGKFVFRLAGVDSSNNNVNVTVDSGTNIYSIGHTYQILAKRENQTLTMVIKQDGTQVFSGNTTIPSNFTLRTIYSYQIGKGPDGYWKGYIDLNNTYIKVNGALWFGHESKMVTWFNGQPSMSKTIDITSCAGTSSLTSDDKSIATNKGWTVTGV